MSALAPTLEAFFTQRLVAQRRASPHTIAAYRDTFCLLLGFMRDRTGKAPVRSNCKTSTHQRSARSWTISSATGTTACKPVTPACQRSTRCSASPRSATPSTPD